MSPVALAAEKGDVYTLDTCPVSGEKLGSMGEVVVKKYDGREIRFCCKACPPKFEASKEKYLKEIDAKLIEQQLKHYPLTTCVVMEADELKPSEHGDPVNFMYRNRLVRFCCKGCVPEFEGDPDAYLKKLDEAVIKQQAEAYPLKTCPISGEALGSMGEPVNYVVGVTLVRFCCKSCIKSFEKDPLPALTKVRDEWKAKHEHP